MVTEGYSGPAIPIREKLITGFIFALLALLQVALVLRFWPFLGHDYAYFLPRLLDVQLHYASNGISVQWWTPSFGAGLPAFANPQHTQFMPAQFLAAWLGPLSGTIVASVCMISLGGLMVYTICLRYLHSKWQVALILGLSFAANGFSLQRLLVGHVSFATLPLVASIPFLLDRNLSRSASAGLFGIFWATVVYGGGYAICVIAGLTILILAAVLPILCPGRFSLGESMRRIAVGIALGAFCAAAKVFAVAHWLQTTPRPGHILPSGSVAHELLSILLRLGFWEWWALFARFFGKHFTHAFSSEVGLWEHDQAIPVPVWFLAICALPVIWAIIKSAKRIEGVVLVISLWVTLEISLTGGPLWSLLNRLPLFSSLHANFRFNAAFILPVILISALGAQTLYARASNRTWNVLLIASVTWILGAQAMRHYIARGEMNRNYRGDLIERNWREHHREGQNFIPITRLLQSGDSDVFTSRGSSLAPYEPIFGYGLPGKNFRTVLRPGPIWGDSINFHYPPNFLGDYLYRTSPFDPAPSVAHESVRQLLNRKQPSWPLPPSVSIAGTVSIIALFGCLSLALMGVRKASQASSKPVAF